MMIRPRPSRSELIADGVLHAFGIGLAVIGAILLLIAASGAAPGLRGAVTVYALALIATFTASALYHLTPWEGLRPILRRIDHAAIYFKIAGTYTPLAVLLGSTLAWIVLALVWVLAALGAGAKLFFWHAPGRLGLAAYLVLGWSSLILIWPLAQTLPAGGMALILAGGLLYTAGTIFFSLKDLRFGTAIWHGFVLAASGCFFAAICWGVLALS